MNEQGISKLLKNLHPDKAAGPDEIRPIILKELHAEIAPILQVIFQASLDTGTLPDDWTKARVAPVYKKGDKHTAANYRPISLTCICCKLMEHIVSSNLVKFLNANNVLYDLQHGFREKRSCETQLVCLVEDLARNLQNCRQTDLVLLDFSKAFDKVNHEKLLLKLHQYGIRGNILRWVRGFLCYRSQTVAVDGEESDEVPVTSGVPQGSVLGPILFLIYINDLPDHVRSKVRLFADDTALYLTLDTPDSYNTLQKDLDNLQIWESLWDMEFNPSKCQVIQVTRSRNPIDTVYTLHNETLVVTPHAKYLGVTIANNLSWSTHIDNITNKGQRSLGFIKRNIKSRHVKTRELAYKTIVRPQLEYASSCWDPYTKDHITKLEAVQRRAARWCLNDFSPYSSVSSMLDRLGWQSLQQRRSTARVVLLYKITYQLVAIQMPPHFLKTTRTSLRNHSLHYHPIYTNRDYYKFSFFPRTVVFWNHLPNSIVNIKDLDAFKDAVSKVPHFNP